MNFLRKYYLCLFRYILLPATARSKGYSTMVSLSLRIYADNGSIRGRLNLALLLNRNSLSERFRNIKDLKKAES